MTTRPAQQIRKPPDKRSLGTDDDEIDVERPREREQPLPIAGADRVAVGKSCDPGVPGSRMELRQRRRLDELPRKRVLATTGADEENAHRASLVLS